MVVRANSRLKRESTQGQKNGDICHLFRVLDQFCNSHAPRRKVTSVSQCLSEVSDQIVGIF